MKTGTVVFVVLAVLLIFSAVQAAQIHNLKVQLEDGAMVAPSSGRTQDLPANLQNLPEMVGGC